MKRLALWAIGLILIATNAFSQNNTYNMVITMSNGTTISIGPNEVKDITFNDGEIQVTGQTLEQVVGQIGTNRIRIDSLSVVTNNLRDYIEVNYIDSQKMITEVKNQIRAQTNEALANVREELLLRIQDSNKNLSDQILYLRDMITMLDRRLQDLEGKSSQQGGSTATDAVAVDLGLPSGTKWADRNVGASKAEDYGGYYAWGETEEKNVYDWSTYIHCDGSKETCHDIGSDISGTQYDVAHVKWGGAWKMPTEDQIKELWDKCTSGWTTVNGISGYKFIGPNGNSIFLPAAGYHWNDGLDDAGTYGYYWSSTLHGSFPFSACSLGFDWGNARWNDSIRLSGNTVRPVCND